MAYKYAFWKSVEIFLEFISMDDFLARNIFWLYFTFGPICLYIKLFIADISLLVLGHIYTVCDTIKRNESDVGDIVFEILAKTVFKFFCFTLFLASTNCSTSDSFLFFNKCLISLDRVTYRYRYFKLKPVQIITRG